MMNDQTSEGRTWKWTFQVRRQVIVKCTYTNEKKNWTCDTNNSTWIDCVESVNLLFRFFSSGFSSSHAISVFIILLQRILLIEISSIFLHICHVLFTDTGCSLSSKLIHREMLYFMLANYLHKDSGISKLMEICIHNHQIFQVNAI